MELTAAVGLVLELGETVLRKREAKEDAADSERARRSTWSELLVQASDTLRHLPENDEPAVTASGFVTQPRPRGPEADRLCAA